MDELKSMLADAVWSANALFARNKATGSSANLSFRWGDQIYITGSGTCFGRLEEASFAVVGMDGASIGGIAPSKELPLHLMLYQKRPDVRAVIHTHSFYATLWSCLPDLDPDDAIPEITPYLRMKVGRIALVPYARPGSEDLFARMRARLDAGDGFILRNHGPVVAGASVMDAFYGIEELEESARMAFHLRGLTNSAVPD